MHPKKLSSKSMDMTTGSTWKLLLSFAVPLLIGNLFQQLYNTVDSLVVGNFVGTEALAAVGSTTSIINTMVMFFNGTSIGASVISRHYGAHDDKKLHLAVETTIMVTFLASILFTALGIFLAPLMLRFMSTPDDVLESASVYLRIYFSGIAGLLVYNMGSAVLRAVGDTKRPLLFLCFSSILNTVLDLVFVIVFHLGIAGVAYATIISQFMSAFLCLYRLMKKSPEEYTVSLRDVRLDSYMLKQIVSNGLPAGIQNSVIAIANVVVQSNINSFGKLAVAGCGAYSKVEGFGFLPITCFSMGLTTFISQNLGAKKYDRAKKGARIGILCSISMAEIVGIIVYFASPVFIAAFNNDPKVIAFGVKEAHIITLFYFLLAFSHCIAGLMRGAGRATVPMFVMLGCWCVIRVTYITIAVKLHPVIQTGFWAYPLTWSLSSILFLIFYLKSDWIHGFEKKRN